MAGLTVEQQRELMETARAKAAASSGVEASEGTAAVHPILRTLPLGQDRDGRLFWALQSSAILTGATPRPLLAVVLALG